MKKFMLFLALAMLPALAFALPTIGQPALDFTGTDYAGAPVKLSDYQGKIVVLEWTNPMCPFVRKHYGSGNMQELQKYAASKGVVWLSINSGAPGKEGAMTPAEAKKYFAETPTLAAHYLLDPTGAIGKLYGAKTTPHMFVIDKKGTLIYMGAIDDKPTADKADIATAHNYVRAAIDSALAGKPVETSSTQSYGCSVKYGE